MNIQSDITSGGASEAEQFSGVIDRLAFHNDETGFSVLRVRARANLPTQTVIGFAALVKPGDHVECEGAWVVDRQRGLQFRAQRISVVPPSTLDGIERYLGSGMIPGIGPGFAKRLVETFGAEVFDVIENDSERLSSVPGLGKKKRQQILAAWSEQRSVRQLMVFLQSHGIGPARAVRIYKTYGDQAIASIQRDPYCLVLDVYGVGFKLADQLAMKLGIASDSPVRARAAVRHVLQEYSQMGHCALERAKLRRDTAKLLSADESIVDSAVDKEVHSGRLIAEGEGEDGLLFLANLYQAEVSIAENFARLSASMPLWDTIDVDAAIPWLRSRTGIELSASQTEAVRLVVNAKVAVITGGPGVGKTTVLNSILKLLRAKGVRPLLCAPTGRAAKRLAESTGLEARTIHRTLEYEPHGHGFKRDESNPLETDMVVVDEVSMVDVNLMMSLINAIPSNAGVLLVGDVDQLPSVGPGSVLADIINSDRVPVARLTEIFRQAASSQIVLNAHRIQRGELPSAAVDDSALTDFYLVSASTPESIFDKLMQLVVERIPQRFGLDPVRDVQVLTPMNKGGLGTKTLNAVLQSKLNPHREPKVSRFGVDFCLGDKVIQTVNNYEKEVYNGDIGFIDFIDSANGELTLNFEGRAIPYKATDLDEVALAYATTVHKSQGSEYPAVVIPLSTQHYTLLERNLLYTAVTRGKKLVVLIAQPKALTIAVNNIRAAARVTRLRSRITALVEQRT